MKLYHGTSAEKADLIEKEGLVGIEVIPGVPTTAFVYMTAEKELAEKYGEVVYEIESDDLDQSKLSTFMEGIGLIHNYQGRIASNLLKRI